MWGGLGVVLSAALNVRGAYSFLKPEVEFFI